MKGAQDNKRNAARGTAQRDRFLWALNPENIRVDARELHAYLSFCARSARLIQNVNTRNEPQGTWAEALEKDPAVFLALVMDNKPVQWDNEIREIIRRFYAASGEGKTKACAALIDKMLALATLLDGWYKNSISLLKWGVESPVSPVLAKAIEFELGEDIRTLQHLVGTTFSTGWFAGKSDVWQAQLLALDEIWKTGGYSEEPPADAAALTEDGMKAAVEVMRQMIQRFQFTMNYIGQKAPEWFEQELEQRHDHDPHIGLLLTFLKLFLHARDQMNTLPARHLDHYYFELLRQKMKPPVPDETVVVFQLADAVRQFLLPEKTLLLAGVNEVGLESHYATKEDVLLSAAQIASLRTTYVSRSDMMKAGSSYKLVSSVYVAPVANSRDGLGAPFVPGHTEWPAFGEEQLNKNPVDRQMVDAQLGFIIAAPILLLREGDREIDLQFRFTEASLSILIDLIDDIAQNTKQSNSEIIPRLFSEALLIYASGEKGWFQIKNWKTDLPEHWVENSALTLHLQLSGDEPSIVDNNPETLGESFDSQWPLLKIVLNPDHNIFLYSFVAPLELDALEIKTRVKGLKSLTMMNEIGLLDNSAPFQPFGAIPNRNSYWLIGSLELFRKRLTDLKMHIEWNNLPDLEGGFSEYYQEYNPEITNDSFKVQLSALSNHAFQPVDAAKREVFPLFSATAPDGKLHARTTIENIRLNYFQIKPDYQTRELPEYSNNLRSGYIKIQLSHIAMAFGHADYPRLFSRAMIEQTRTAPGLFGLPGEKPKEVAMPREPFTPVIEKLTVDYTATTTFNLMSQGAEENDKQAGEKIIALYPFGNRVIFDQGKAYDHFLFTRFANDGYLYIGLTNVQPGQPVYLLFNIQESKYPAQNDFLKVTWSFLRANNWEVFSEDSLLADKTRQFTTSGIVSLLLPSEIETDNSIMPGGMFWLRAAAKGNLEVIGRVLDVRINAVEVQWVDNGDATHFDPAATLPKIRQLLAPQPEIAALDQPLGFYGARPAEQLPGFYVRTSERLRHKNRAITTWDVERLVLENFPELRRVKCIGWMEYKKMPPGHIKVVVIPQRDPEDREPKVGFFQLNQIDNFLQEKTSAFAQIQVINPVYERIKVTCRIVLEKGLEHEKGKYLQLLHDELRLFICPWLEGASIVLGGDISKNDLLNFIKSRPYVRFVTRFSLVQIFEQEAAGLTLADTAGKASRSEILQASTPWSILIPVELHNIQFLPYEDNLSPAETAIEDMRLETDFIVLEGPADDQPDTGVKLHEIPDETETDTEFYLFPNTGREAE